ncbi:hypothetical protein CVT25_004106 [Psilocybe cyanescens]|uniref:Uncharacterized protein n=1 Tax=Psilocybe cyanescens TaxID=93625 RepID=A0A409X2Z7_PSICY|nr:hypothetical protein CVT25_004106 [Psilocybe cyanescens]
MAATTTRMGTVPVAAIETGTDTYNNGSYDADDSDRYEDNTDGAYKGDNNENGDDSCNSNEGNSDRYEDGEDGSCNKDKHGGCEAATAMRTRTTAMGTNGYEDGSCKDNTDSSCKDDNEGHNAYQQPNG